MLMSNNRFINKTKYSYLRILEDRFLNGTADNKFSKEILRSFAMDHCGYDLSSN